jgi:hypothetical protein
MRAVDGSLLAFDTGLYTRFTWPTLVLLRHNTSTSVSAILTLLAQFREDIDNISNVAICEAHPEAGHLR